jgi:selenocysteine-specific elongation factor
VVGGVTVLDVVPPALRRRGAAAARAAELTTMDGVPDAAAELRRRGLVRRADLDRMGVGAGPEPVAGQWLADPEHWTALQARLADAVHAYAREHPLDPGAPVEALRRSLDLPDRALVEALVRPPLVARAGRVAVGTTAAGELPPPVADAVRRLMADLKDRPFAAPEAYRLTELGLGPKQIGAAVRAGALLRLADAVVLPADAADRAAEVLAGLPQPFTLSEARRALDTSRRVAVPLLELLDRTGRTRRLPDDRRTADSG